MLPICFYPVPLSFQKQNNRVKDELLNMVKWAISGKKIASTHALEICTGHSFS